MESNAAGPRRLAKLSVVLYLYQQPHYAGAATAAVSCIDCCVVVSFVFFNFSDLRALAGLRAFNLYNEGT